MSIDTDQSAHEVHALGDLATLAYFQRFSNSRIEEYSSVIKTKDEKN